ncbi:MAG: tRNA uridine-5-carboxymethylaminomethyl(34) synthesis GTPase MnmE [Deltaproteobacteria bacterium]|nr:tRNA uridine-5-carboxymethylaminomethyl(34) synthesis GTPase MnmE [Deltaproteobacteria bacterium]
MTFDLLRVDTICALATADAPAAIAVVRVSGPRADNLRHSMFVPRHGAQRPYVATRGDVLDERGRVLDDCVCTAWPDGHSYTGEASFELSLHGSPVITRAVLRSLVARGCRLAEPGELTLRAVLTGRIDLTAAEAIDDVIRARTDEAARAAGRSLRGGLAKAVEGPRAALVDALAEIEARLDFPDEELGTADVARLAARLAAAHAALQRLLRTSSWGARLRDGARVVLYGPPNAGKSTLLNALAGEERALVHHEPGTTRDALEVELELGGTRVTVIDVAGVRPLADVGAVERLGIARADQERARADVVVALVPADAPDALATLHALGGDVLVLSKVDLGAPKVIAPDVCLVSAKDDVGLDALQVAIARKVGPPGPDDEVTLLRERQVVCVQDAAEALARAQSALDQQAPGEVVASELRSSGRALDRLLGKDLGPEVLEAVFSRFCIGK